MPELGTCPGGAPSPGKGWWAPQQGKMSRLGMKVMEQALCVRLPTQPRPCSHRAHPSSSLQVAPLDFSIPNQIPPGRVSLPGHLPGSSVGCTRNEPRASHGSTGAGPAAQPGVPETLWGLKGDSGTRSAEPAAAWAPIFPLEGDQGWAGLGRTPSRERAMSSCGCQGVSWALPQPCCQPRWPGHLSQGSVPRMGPGTWLQDVGACIPPFSLNSPKVTALLLPRAWKCPLGVTGGHGALPAQP